MNFSAVHIGAVNANSNPRYQNALGSGSQSRAQRNVRPMESASTFRRSAAGELSYGTSKLDWNYGLEVRHC